MNYYKLYEENNNHGKYYYYLTDKYFVDKYHELFSVDNNIIDEKKE